MYSEREREKKGEVFVCVESYEVDRVELIFRERF